MERLHLQVLAETNLNFYVVFNTVYVNPNGISTNPKNVYWFPQTIVKPGDQVVLYSGFGQNKVEPATDKTKNYFFYWGQPNTLWTNRGDCAVLLELNNWQTSVFE